MARDLVIFCVSHCGTIPAFRPKLMSTVDGLSESVKSFLREHVSSVEQLEILLYLHRIAPHQQTAQAIADTLYISSDSAASRLASFAERGLVRTDGGTPPEYGIALNGDVTSKLNEVAACYRERRVAVINYIFSNPISTIQSFADAFIIGKKKGGS